jgi:phosphatidylethanolamine-binding protein (PEBP) family uncharacterized protein
MNCLLRFRNDQTLVDPTAKLAECLAPSLGCFFIQPVLSLLTSSLSLARVSRQEARLLIEKRHWNNFGCSVSNEMPALDCKHAHSGTKRFAITVYDRDAPTGSGVWHSVVYASAANGSGLDGGIKVGKIPAAIHESDTDFGKPGFSGPCPAVECKHPYSLTIDAQTSDKGDVTAAMTGFLLWQNTIANSCFSVTAGPGK